MIFNEGSRLLDPEKPQFLCTAEYGIQEGDYIQRRITGCNNIKEAKKYFIQHLKESHPVEWEKIGNSNVHVEEIKDEKQKLKNVA